MKSCAKVSMIFRDYFGAKLNNESPLYFLKIASLFQSPIFFHDLKEVDLKSFASEARVGETFIFSRSLTGQTNEKVRFEICLAKMMLKTNHENIILVSKLTTDVETNQSFESPGHNILCQGNGFNREICRDKEMCNMLFGIAIPYKRNSPYTLLELARGVVCSSFSLKYVINQNIPKILEHYLLEMATTKPSWPPKCSPDYSIKVYKKTGETSRPPYSRRIERLLTKLRVARIMDTAILIREEVYLNLD